MVRDREYKLQTASTLGSEQGVYSLFGFFAPDLDSPSELGDSSSPPPGPE